MRRLCISIVVLGSLLLPATSARAEASGNHHLTARGLAASAFFSDRPSSGALPGVVYKDTFVVAADESATFDGTHQRSDFVYVNQYEYTLSEGGWMQFVGYAYGVAQDDDLSFVRTGALTKAGVTAAVAMTHCAGDAVPICAADGVKTLDVAWTGVGDVTRGISHSNWSTGPFRFISRNNGRSRAASATGTFVGTDLGASVGGSLADTKSMSMTICRDC